MNAIRILSLCLVAILQAGCQNNSDGEDPCDCLEKKKDWLYVNFSAEPPTYDFRKTSCRTTAILTEMLYEGLMKVGRDGSIEPAQAGGVVISSDGLQYIFMLRDTYWSDGRPVTAHDFVSAWKECLDPNFPAAYAHLFYCIKNAQAAKEGRCLLSEVGIRAEGEKKLVIELERPTAYFLSLTTSTWYFPIRPPKKEVKGQILKGDLVANGPFMLQKWHPGNQICVVKNPHYRCEQAIILEGINISLINDENTAAELFEHGDFDLLGMPFSPIPSDLARTLKEKIASVPVGSVTVCCFNTTRSPFQHPKIRRAFSMALDRRQMMDVIYPSAYAPASTLVPPVFWPANVAEHINMHDRMDEIQMARRDFEEGLAELGLDRSRFPTVQLAYNMHKGHILFQKLAEIMQQDWRDVLGVEVVLQGLEVQTLIQRMVAKDYDTALITWSANYQDPMCFFDKFLTAGNSKNYPGWTHPAFNDAIVKANTLLDVKKRTELLWQAEKIFQEEAPCAPLFHWSYPIVTHSGVQGLYMSPAASIDFTSLRVVPHAKKEHKKMLKMVAGSSPNR